MNDIKTPRRTTSLGEFARQLNSRMDEIQKREGLFRSPRIFRISAPVFRGRVEVVLEHSDWNGYKSLYLESDGTWTETSYWSEDQI